MSKKCKCGCEETLEEEKHECNCNGECNCGEDCQCDAENKCCEDCTCEQNGECCEEYEGEQFCEVDEHQQYLSDLQRLQAEFDNYRKRMTTSLGEARQDGFVEAIVGFLPALDSFKMATEMITDKNTLMGIKFIEKGILDTLSKIGVEEIVASGKFDPNVHQAVDIEDASDFESGDIVKEVAKGFKYKDKVIRYSQVIVKK